MKFCSLASGSSGNSEFVSSGSTSLLIDAGISTKRIVTGLESVGASPDLLDGILVTHEHSDHIKGLDVFLSKYNVPLYGTMPVLDAVAKADKKHRIDRTLFKEVKPDKAFVIGDIEVMPFATSHDAGLPVCYTLTNGRTKLGMATDLGMYDSYIISKLSGSNILFVEANYDLSMLQAGPYPFSLKKRILSDVGHLSNDMGARLILQLLGRHVSNVFLGHLSKENNYPELAYETVRYELSKEYGDISRFYLTTAERDNPSCRVGF